MNVLIARILESNVKGYVQHFTERSCKNSSCFLLLVSQQLRGGGVRAWPLRKKIIFFEARKKIPRGGGKALMAGPQKKNFIFCGFPHGHSGP